LFSDIIKFHQRSREVNPNAYVLCTASKKEENGEICDDQGNLDNDNYGGDPQRNPFSAYDTRRLQFSLSERQCGITINQPHANDTGEWKCFVNNNNPVVAPQIG